jgi:hypothetical protein
MKQSYFIRKNTPKLRDKLKELGYHICPCALFEDSVWLHTSFLTDEPTVHGIGFVDEEYTGRKTIQEELDFFLYENSKSQNPWIDCGDNEELFITLAEYKDGTAKNQWFVADNIWVKCSNDIPDKYIQLNGHKATPEEIIKHFKNKN